MQSLETLITAVRYRERDRDRFDPEHELEYLCDVGAAEILLPAEEFESDLAVSGSTLRAVPALRERYQASREATVRRMLQMGSERTAAVFLEYRLKPSRKLPHLVDTLIVDFPGP
jgi:Zn-dependent peptidase ImmA (M78 family)